MNYRTRQSSQHQKGISLFVVLIILLLTLTAVLGAARVGLLNESLIGSSSDYSRALAAAEALVRDAEVDIKGRRPPYTLKQTDGQLGWPCRPDPADSTTSIKEMTGYEASCRLRNSATSPWYPQSNDEFDSVADIVFAHSATKRCKEGICFPADTTTHAKIEDDVAGWKDFGATYGQYTRDSLTAAGVAGNPALVESGSRVARYWVEAFRYGQGVGSGTDIATNLVPTGERNFIYRITAVVQGLKPGTQVVIKSIYVPYPKAQGG